MKKRIAFLVTAVLLITMAAPVFADDLKFTIGSFVETKSNLDDNIQASGGGIIGADFKVQYNDLYVKIAEESRSGGSALRQKYILGYNTLSFGAFSLKPEYEFRTNSAMDDMFGDSAEYEHRFKLNFGGKFGDHRAYLNTMPTLKHDSDDLWYFHEVELGYRFMISGSRNFALALFNELEMTGDNSDIEQNEIQVRLYYSHKFENGISVNPYARISVYRKALGERYRVGSKLSYSASNGLAPFGEVYWEGTDKASGFTNDLMAKFGMSYSW